MNTTEVSVKCRCGYEHTNFDYIRFVRDRLNQPKAFCTRCNRRVFVCRYSFLTGTDKEVLVR